MAAIFLAIALVATSQAVAIDDMIARYTDAQTFHRTVPAAPETTPPPPLNELMKRASISEIEILLAPDNTCGYVDKQASSAYRCVNSYATCGIIPSAGMVACLSSTNTFAVTTCADSKAISSKLCDNTCQSDAFILKCTGSTASYCGTVDFGNNIKDYFCDTASSSIAYQADTTYSNQIGRVFDRSTITFTNTDTTSGSGTVSTTTPGVNSPIRSITTTTIPDASATATPESAHDSGIPVGAIVGGVIGGLALVALIAFGVWFAVRRKRKGSPSGAQPLMQSSYTSYPQTHPAPMNHQHQGVPSFQQYQPESNHFSDPAKSPTATTVVPVSAQPASPPPPSFSSVPPSLNVMDRQSAQPASPASTVYTYSQTPGAQPVANPNMPPTVHEAGGDMVGTFGQQSNHKGQLHEVE